MFNFSRSINWVLATGIVLLLIGGGLMVKGFFVVEEKHEASILGTEFSVTEKHTKVIPAAVSGTVFAIGAALTVLGGVRRNK